MLRILAVTPAIAPIRALADGTSGTLGREVVNTYELGRGAVTLDRMADLSGARVLGRASGAASGPPTALDAAALRRLVDAGSVEIALSTEDAARLTPAAATTLALRTLGYLSPGDGGGAIYRRLGFEPVHAGKIQSQDGSWWELAPNQRITPQMFGAVGDGATDDASAFDAAIDFCRRRGTPLHIPRGDYLLSELAPLFTDSPSAREQLRLEGAGRDLTRLLYAHDLNSPLLDASPEDGGRLAGLDVVGLTIDGRGFKGQAIFLRHMSKCVLRELKIRNVLDIGINGREWWDSMVTDVEIHTVGDPARSLPSIRLANSNTSDSNSSCNNIGFYDLHIEEHPYRAIEIRHTSRKLTFNRLKCHHNPLNYPADGTDHVVLDALNAPAGAGYGITFQGCHLAVSTGSAYVLDNTGGPGDQGFSGVSINGGSIQAPLEYGVKALKAAGVVISDTWIRDAGKAAFFVASDCRDVCPVWPSIHCETSVEIQYGIADASAPNSIAARIEGGQIAAVGGYMVVDAPEGAGSGVLTRINGGKFGQTLLLTGRSSARAVTVRESGGGNIRTQGGQDRTLLGPEDSLLLRYDDVSARWNEVSYLSL